MTRYHVVSRIAIYILSIVLIAYGIYSFKYPRDLIVYVPPFLPGGIKWAYVVGGAFILVGLSFLTNQYVKVTSYVLFFLLVAFILAIHMPNYFDTGDKEESRRALVNILKDTAIAAFALHIAAGAHHQHLHFEESD